jgi:hypothetical protein
MVLSERPFGTLPGGCRVSFGHYGLPPASVSFGMIPDLTIGGTAGPGRALTMEQAVELALEDSKE